MSSVSMVAIVLAVVAGMAILFLWLHQRQKQLQRIQSEQVLKELRLLRQLITALQRHRGLSNGVLNGDDRLLAELIKTRDLVSHHIQSMSSLHPSRIEAWEALCDHWGRLRQNDGLTVDTNLAQHNILIRNSLYLLEDVAVSADLTHQYPNLQHVPALWRHLVPAAEWTGQARALGTGLAAQGVSTPEQRVRMRYLYQKIAQTTQSTFQILQAHTRQFPEMKLTTVDECRAAVDAFLACIQSDLLAGEEPTMAAPLFFEKATYTIDRLFDVVDEGLSQLEQVHHS
ncbi:MAG: nitrate- and nitrite sensing domain-containing protein [Bacterioplanes sp.]|nr:nitrate- and nitrite sensing domain-containing protein [Bacterioplanes sp.]